MIIDEDAYLSHYGVKGMRWGQRRARKKQEKADKKAAKEREIQEFRDSVLRDIGTRSPSEIFAVRGTRGPTMIMTGEEFIQNANLGMPFVSIQSTGMQIDDGR